jgi:hypothetical protein
MKAAPEEMELHIAVLNGEDIALSKLYDNYSMKITRELESRFQSTAKKDNDFISRAVNDTFLSYYFKPGSFNPEKNTLFGFLKFSAIRDLLNILDREKKHLLGKNLIEDVELWKTNGNSILKSYSSADATILSDEIMTITQNVLKEHFHSEKDIAIAILVLSEIRETEYYSEELEISDLTLPEQRIEVKKHKDRVKKVIERNDIVNKIKNLLK